MSLRFLTKAGVNLAADSPMDNLRPRQLRFRVLKTSLLAAWFAVPTAAQQISWSVPEDGGTPRNANRIEHIGPQEFRIRASFEEGGSSVLRHAVSRVDLICHNGDAQPAKVTVHLDLSDDGRRTDYDNKPEAGMKQRDFIFIQPPSKDWRQVDGTTEAWVATVSFDAAPGETKIGLSPWYAYADYLRFVNALPRHPHLEKRLAGRSDGGLEHWELTITDPAVPAEQKRKIFWHAREHAYETYSSFAMEGLVEFLLSDEAADFRRRYLILLHHWKDETTPLRYNWAGRLPLSEANLHQYAMKKHGTRVWGWEMPWWNYSVPEVRASGAAFARAFLTTIEEIRANAALGSTGYQPVPSGNLPEGTGMRSVLSKRASPNSNAPPVSPGGSPGGAGESPAPPIKVARWEMHEFSARGRARVQNPFRDAALVGEFVSPSGKTNVVDGFYDDADTWRLRFAPDEEGDWDYLLRGEGVEILQRGMLRCTAARGHGFVRIHPENPYAFAHADGTAFLPMGDTCYGLFDDSPITPELRDEYLKTRRRQRFNFVRLTVGHSEARAATNSHFWAWGGTAQRPDLERFNPVFFRAFDDLMRQLRTEGMNVELILLNFYRRPFTDTNVWTAARERQWLRYLIARYSAFDNVFLWTVANEYETRPDGRYRLDFPGDVDWAKATARFIKAIDPHRHLVTVHPVISASRRGDNPRAPFDPPWRIGEFFGEEDAIDVLSQQTGQSGESALWDEKLQCWTGDSETLVASLSADRRFRKPVLNTENGYEYLRGHPTEKKQVHHTDKVRRSAWRIVCAGGYFAAGFHGTIGHSDAWNRIDPQNHYTFTVKDEGAAVQLAELHEFFAALPFWRMDPFTGVTGDVVALAEPGKAYLVYFPHGGATTMDLAAAQGPLTTRWFNPRTGNFGEPMPVVPTGVRQDFQSPDTNDWALLVTSP